MGLCGVVILQSDQHFALLVSPFQYWLDLDKQMNHQVGMMASSSSSSLHHQQPAPGSCSSDPLLRFCVKFYTPDPAQIEEEYTRYLFSLQVKRDLALGQLQCNDNTAALMASYIVQGEYRKTKNKKNVNLMKF